MPSLFDGLTSTGYAPLAQMEQVLLRECASLPSAKVLYKTVCSAAMRTDGQTDRLQFAQIVQEWLQALTDTMLEADVRAEEHALLAEYEAAVEDVEAEERAETAAQANAAAEEHLEVHAAEAVQMKPTGEVEAPVPADVSQKELVQNCHTRILELRIYRMEFMTLFDKLTVQVISVSSASDLQISLDHECD